MLAYGSRLITFFRPINGPSLVICYLYRVHWGGRIFGISVSMCSHVCSLYDNIVCIVMHIAHVICTQACSIFVHHPQWYGNTLVPPLCIIYMVTLKVLDTSFIYFGNPSVRQSGSVSGIPTSVLGCQCHLLCLLVNDSCNNPVCTVHPLIRICRHIWITCLFQ